MGLRPVSAGGRCAMEPAEAAPAPRSRLWWWFVAAFAVQLAAWGVWLTIAARHPVQDVPLVRAR